MSFISMVCIFETERFILQLFRNRCGPDIDTCDEVLRKAGMMAEAVDEDQSS